MVATFEKLLQIAFVCPTGLLHAHAWVTSMSLVLIHEMCHVVDCSLHVANLVNRTAEVTLSFNALACVNKAIYVMDTFCMSEWQKAITLTNRWKQKCYIFHAWKGFERDIFWETSWGHCHWFLFIVILCSGCREPVFVTSDQNTC